jgi:hypothetical protein
VSTTSTLPTLTPVSHSATSTTISGGNNEERSLVGLMLWAGGFGLAGFAAIAAIVWNRRKV